MNEFESVHTARVTIEEFAWHRLHDHAFERAGAEKRTCVVTVTREHAWVVGGISDLVLLKTTDSEFHGYIKDRYTTLAETSDRIMATSLTARWRYLGTDVDWGKVYSDIRRILLARFAEVHSLALQQTLWEMGRAALLAHPEVAEVMLTAPNKHHFVVDLSPFGLDNPNEVFHADDRPYGLIECNVTRDDAPPAGPAWQTVPGLT